MSIFQYSVTKLFADLGGVLHGTTINQITNNYGLINRAASKFMLDCDAIESIRILPFPSTIYNQVYDYPLPPDVKGNKLIDIQPQIDRTTIDIWTQSYIQAFDVAKATWLQNGFALQYNSGIKTIRINAPYLPVPISINELNSIGNNGTWTTGGDATDLEVNNTNFLANPASLQLDLSGATGSGYIENSTMQPVNLSTIVNQAVQFFYTSFPTANQFTSVELQWGSSPTDYYSSIQTINQQNTVFENGWNLLANPWLGATVTGTPDPSTITYARITWNYAVGKPQTGVLVNNLVSNLGKVLNLVYYSKYFFSDPTSGAYKQFVTSNNDLINLDQDAYQIFFNLVAYLAMQQQQGLDAAFYDGNFFLTQYQEGLARYKTMYPSQMQKAQSTYYKVQNGNNYYGRLGGAWWNR